MTVEEQEANDDSIPISLIGTSTTDNVRNGKVEKLQY